MSPSSYFVLLTTDFEMGLLHSSKLFVLWIFLSFLRSFVESTQIINNSTSNSEGEEDYEDDDLDGLGRVLLIIFAVFVAGVFLALVSIVFIIAGGSRNEKFKGVMFCDL